MNTRTVLLWHNNGEERIYFTVNPARLTVTRPNENRVRSLAMGGTVNIWGGRGLREVRLTTFLPSAYSPFFDGKEPESVLAMLKSWQDSGDPVRLIISGSDINDAFLIEDVSETLAEGDRDVGLTVTLREYKFKSALAALAGGTGTTMIVENMFDSRYRHVDELARMGADIQLAGRVAVVTGSRLHGADVRSTDLRGGAALVVAALGAEGVSRVSGLNHIRRGYQGLDDGLAALGADIRTRL